MPSHYDKHVTGQETNEAEQGPTSSVEQTERDKGLVKVRPKPTPMPEPEQMEPMPELLQRSNYESLGNQLLKSIKSMMWRQGY